MQNRLICVVCNLKPAKLAGFVSEGMVLAAQGSDGTVELVRYVIALNLKGNLATLY
jgi:tRNA-binding EMAP/Myf-like protein